MKLSTPAPLQLWAVIVCLAAYGGIARHIIKLKKNGPCSPLSLVSQVIVSAFAGVMAALGMVEGSLSPCAVYLAAGAAGFAGADALMKFIPERRADVQIQPGQRSTLERDSPGSSASSQASASAQPDRLPSDRGIEDARASGPAIAQRAIKDDEEPPLNRPRD